MIKEFIGIEEALEVLNRIVDADPTAAKGLVDLRVPCSIALAEDESIQVGIHTLHEATLSLLGVVNGFFGIDEDGNGAILPVFVLECSDDCLHMLADPPLELDACPLCGAEVVKGRCVKFVRNPNLKYEDDL